MSATKWSRIRSLLPLPHHRQQRGVGAKVPLPPDQANHRRPLRERRPPLPQTLHRPRSIHRPQDRPQTHDIFSLEGPKCQLGVSGVFLDREKRSSPDTLTAHGKGDAFAELSKQLEGKLTRVLDGQVLQPHPAGTEATGTALNGDWTPPVRSER